MVRNHEKKMTRKIRKNRRTRKRNVGRIRTKKWKTRMSYKTMKRGGGLVKTIKSLTSVTALRRELDPATGTIGSNIENTLNRIAKKMNEFAVLVANEQCYIDLWKELFKEIKSRMSFTEAYKYKNKENIPFIPDQHLTDIPSTIQTLIDSIEKAYEEMYKRRHSFKLTSVDFNQALNDVCKGEIHRNSGCFGPFKCKSNLSYVNLNESLLQLCEAIDPSEVGWSPASFQIPQTPKKAPIFSIEVAQAVLWKWESDNSTKFNDFSDEHYRLLEQAYKSGQPQLQVPEKQWVFDFKTMRQSKIGGTDRRIVRIAPPLKDTYETLRLFFGNEQLLDPNKIKCMACMIVMPNGERTLEDVPTEEYGRDYGYKYFDFSKRIWSWEENKGHRLEPNMYCSNRVLRRTIEGQPIDKKNITKLRYTMSPIIIPTELSNPEYLNDTQKLHDELLSALLMVAQTIAKTNVSESSSMKRKFQNYEEITFTQILTSSPDIPDPKQWKYFFYELKIYKKKLTYETSKVFDAVIVEFKAFSEDGICGKELIFVSYLHVKNADFQPGTPQLPEPTNLPGTVFPGRGNQALVSLPGVGSVKEPPSPVIGDEKNAKNEIRSMFGKKFNDLRIKLSFENDGLIDRVILPFNNQGGRGYSRAPATGSFENRNEVHHIVLTQDERGYKWDIRPATTTQINAFNAVQNYIKNKATNWKFENSQNTFVVTNNVKGPDEIKVIVTVKEVKEIKEGTDDTLKIVEYQAESAPTYLLFAGRDAARNYIQAKMGVITTNILPQAMPPQAMPPQAMPPQAMPPPPPLQALPIDWIQQNAPDETPFYVYTPTAHVQWNRPLDPLPLPKDWIDQLDNGKIFYVNTNTGQKQWNRP